VPRIVANAHMTDLLPDHADREAAALSVLRRCSAILGRASTTGEVATAIAQDVIPAIGGMGGSLFELDADVGVLRLVVADAYPTEVIDRYAVMALDAPTPPADAVRTREPVLLGDIDDARRRYPELVAAGELVESEERGHAWAHLPLVAGDDVVGVVIAAFRDRQPFDASQALVLTMAADVAAQALVRAHLLDDERRAHEFVAANAVAIAESEELIRTIAENAASALLMMDEHGRATYANHAWVQMTGFDLDDMASRSIHDVVHHTHPDGTPYPSDQCPIDRALAAGRVMEPYEDTFIRKDGTFFPVRAAASPILRAGRREGTVIEVQDITEEKARERMLRDAETRVRFLADASAALARSFDLDATLNEVTRLAVPTIADFCFVDLVRSDGELERVAAAHRRDEAFLDKVRGFVPGPANERHPIRRAFASGEPVLVADVDDAWIDEIAESAAQAELKRAEGLTGEIAVPVKARNGTIGVLTLAVVGTRRFVDADVEMAEELARGAAVAIDNARLFHRSEFQRSLLEAQGEASIDGQLVVDAHGRVLSFNGRFVEIWDIPPEVVEQGDEAALAVATSRLEDPDAFIARVREIYADRSPSHDELRFRDGRTIERHGSPVTSLDGAYHGYLWSFRDISERKRAADRLAVSEERFRSLVSATAQIVWTTGPDGRFVERSPSWEAFTGQRPEDYVGRLEGPFAAFHPEDRQRVLDAWVEAVTGRTDGVTYRYRLRRHDGRFRRVVARAVALRDPDGSVREWVGSVTDVEDELTAREALDRQFEVTNAITENATSALVMLDERGSATYVNDAWTSVTGFGADEVLGTSTHDLVHHSRPDGTPFPQEECPLVQALPEGRRIDPYEDMLIRKDGSFFPARIAASPILVEGRAVGTVLEIQDVTEEHRIRAALEARQTALLRLHDVAVAFGRARTEQEIADALADEGIPVVGADRGAVLLVRGASMEIVSHRGVPEDNAARFRSSPLSSPTPSAEAIRTDGAIWIEDLAELDERFPAVADEFRTMGGRAGAWVPLSAEGGAIGVVAFQFDRERAFTAEDKAAVGALTRQAAQALERVRLLSRETRARRRAELIAEVMIELERVRGVRPLARRLLELLVPRVADYASLEAPAEADPVLAIAHRDPEKLVVFRALRSDRLRLPADDPRSVARVAEGGPQLIPEIDAAVLRSFAADDETLRNLTELAARSHVSVPVQLGASRGALVLGISDPGRRVYDDDDLELFVDLASRVSLRFQNAQLQEEEHRIALRLQRALLPDGVVRHPSVAIAAHYEAGSELLEVGGDWYDTFVLPGDRIGLVVGDVVGHGVEAAAAMGRVRSALAALAQQGLSPGEVLEQLDRFAAGRSGVDFATVCYAVLDPATRELRYASAGHPPILVVEPDGRTRWLEGGRSVPVFAGLAGEREDAVEILGPGSMLVLYSDGLVERRGERLSTGLERLAETASGVRALPAQEAGDRILTALGADRTHDDDVVVLCVQVHGAPVGPLEIVVPADPGELRAVRAAARRWLQDRGVEMPSAGEVLLVLGEACSNAIEHAYDGDGGDVHVAVQLSDGVVEIQVRDRGRWRMPPADPTRGRGTGIMEAVSTTFRRTTDEHGTTVVATVPVEADRHG
jgi:PAS domain S-box-containing protein